jgi:hypothetical protein
VGVQYLFPDVEALSGEIARNGSADKAGAENSDLKGGFVCHRRLLML